MTIYDASTQALGNDNPTVAFGLTGISSRGTQLPFLDLMKSARTWLGHAPKDWGAMNVNQLEAGGYLDEDGWVTGIPDGMDRVGTIWNFDYQNASDYQKGVFVVRYEGEGTLEVSGSTVEVLSQEDGMVTFRNPSGGTVSLDIMETDPNGTGDYIRDITVVREDMVDLYDAGAIFNPEWIELIADSRQLRFMDWMNTNKQTSESWDDYPTADSANWDTVPVEVMVRLANEVGTDPWFNIPHLADDDFVRQFAEYVRDNLDPDLTVRVEWSNEAWNGSFAVADWLNEQALAEWGIDGYKAQLSYQAKRATEVALIWEEVFAESDDSPELVNVIGSRTGGEYSNEQVLEAPLWELNDPDGYVAPHTVFDELAVTTYFGGTTVRNEDMRAELIEKILDPTVDATAWFAEKLLDPSYGSSVPNIALALQNSKSVADSFGLDLVAYEGGQHVHHSFSVRGLTQDQADILNDFMAGFVRSPEMAELYEALYDAWAQVSDNPFMQFGDVRGTDKYGSWGLLENLDDTNPRAEFLLDKLANDRAWWGDTGNEAYLQGKYESGTDGNDQIIGTDQEDFLAGGQGDDDFYAAKGRDGINGGAGSDQLYLEQGRSEYTIVADGPGHLVSGPDGDKFVINVENFVFRDGETVSLADFLSGNPGTTTDIPDQDTGTTDQPDTDTTDQPDTDTTDLPDADDQSGDDGASDTDQDDSSNEADPSDNQDPNEEETAENDPNDGGTNEEEENTADAINSWRAAEGLGDESNGITIVTINNSSELGDELNLGGRSGLGSGYIAIERGTTINFTSDSGEILEVAAKYYALNENLTGKNGEQISDSAIETAEMFGEIIVAPEAIYATDMNDSFVGRKADDVVFGEGGNDYLNGQKGDDTLNGGTGDDKLLGGKGNDDLTGGEGNDKITGGQGSDRFYFAAGDGHDQITDFELQDTLALDNYFVDGDTLTSDHTSQDANGNAVISNGSDSITLLGLNESELDSWLSIA